MSHRTQRIADVLRRELSDVLVRRIRDPRVRLASIADVRVTPDLRRATVAVSVVGSDEEREDALAALTKARAYVRGELGRGLRGLKVIPEVFFELDRNAEYSQRINELLDTLHDED